VLAWLSLWSGVHTCIWPSWCYCHSLSLTSVKSRLVLPFWYRLIRVVPDKGPTWSDFITWTTLKIHDCVIDWLQEGAKNSVWNWARGKEKHYSETDVTGGAGEEMYIFPSQSHPCVYAGLVRRSVCLCAVHVFVACLLFNVGSLASVASS